MPGGAGDRGGTVSSLTRLLNGAPRGLPRGSSSSSCRAWLPIDSGATQTGSARSSSTLAPSRLRRSRQRLSSGLRFWSGALISSQFRGTGAPAASWGEGTAINWAASGSGRARGLRAVRCRSNWARASGSATASPQGRAAKAVILWLPGLNAPMGISQLSGLPAGLAKMRRGGLSSTSTTRWGPGPRSGRSPRGQSWSRRPRAQGPAPSWLSLLGASNSRRGWRSARARASCWAPPGGATSCNCWPVVAVGGTGLGPQGRAFAGAPKPSQSQIPSPKPRAREVREMRRRGGKGWLKGSIPPVKRNAKQIMNTKFSIGSKQLIPVIGRN